MTEYQQDPIEESFFDTSVPDRPDPDLSEEEIEMDLPPTTDKPIINAQVINTAYEGYKTAIMRQQTIRQAYNDACTNRDRAVSALDFQKQEAIIDGKNPGKNQEQREAFSHQLFYAEYENVSRMNNECTVLNASVNYVNMVVELWKIECERVDKLMDLLTLDMASHQTE